jgi:hypothetical protein
VGLLLQLSNNLDTRAQHVVVELELELELVVNLVVELELVVNLELLILIDLGNAFSLPLLNSDQ